MSKNNKKFVFYFAILIFPLFLLFAKTNIFSPVKFQVVEKSSFLIRIVSIPIFELKKLFYYRRTFDEYMSLRKEVNVLKGRMIGLEEVIRENTRLEKLLNLKRQLLYSSVSASVIGRDPSNWNSSMIIDKGLKDGISQGMPVVNSMGVVGKIIDVGDHTSKVILINDPNFSVPALIERPREIGLVSGTLQGLCRMRYLSSDASIEVGDKVITAKISTSFPEGILVGEVIGVQKNSNDSSLECILQPAVKLSQVEEVLVIQK